MDERKILLFILSVIIYCLYSVHMWFTKENVEVNNKETPEMVIPVSQVEEAISNKTEPKKVKIKAIPLFIKDRCSVLEVFVKKPEKKIKRTKPDNMDDSNTIAVIGITVFLVVLVLNAALDVLKVKEEERARRKLNPNGERRQSLAEFANKKTLRRESSKFGLQLFQIAESFVNPDNDKENHRQSRPYTRGESTTSYFSEKKKTSEGSAPASISETSSAEPKLIKRQSTSKLIGGRPVPMVRRSSFPVLPLNPEVQALMLGHRQSSFDSDDESDGKGRRVRIIRRY